MEASDHSEVSAFGLDLKKNLGFHFSILIHKKIFKLHLDNFSKHFVKTMREGKNQSLGVPYMQMLIRVI